MHGPTSLPEHTQILQDARGYAAQHQRQGLTPQELHPRHDSLLPKGPSRVHVPAILVAGICVTFVGLMAWWVLDGDEVRDLDPLPPRPRVAAVAPPPPPPPPPPQRQALPAPPLPELQVPAPKPKPRKKPKRRKPKPKKPETPAPPAPEPPAPEPKLEPLALPPAYERSLSAMDIRLALRRPRALIHQHCDQPLTQVTLNAHITVRPNGLVDNVRIDPPFNRSSIGRCVKDLVQVARFPVRARTSSSVVDASFHVGGRPGPKR